MAKDFYHETVKRALEKDGWLMTQDPFVLKYKDLAVFADLERNRFSFKTKMRVKSLLISDAKIQSAAIVSKRAF